MIGEPMSNKCKPLKPDALDVNDCCDLKSYICLPIYGATAGLTSQGKTYQFYENLKANSVYYPQCLYV